MHSANCIEKGGIMKNYVHLKKVLAFLACIMMAALVLAACATPAKAPSMAPATSEPRSGGTLRLAISQVPTSLDPFIAGVNSPGSIAVNKIFNSTLVQWKGANDSEAVLAPALAKSWETSPDGQTYTFHLQEGVKWQNVPPVNGREFTADDVKYHLDRIKDPANKYQMRASMDIKSTEVVDKYTVKVTTNSKVPGYVVYCCFDMPVPKEVVEAPGGADKNWVGTGAFILTEYQPNVKAVFKKNPDYWEKGKPYLDAVELYFIPDAAARLAAFRSGQIDVLPQEGKINRDNVAKSAPEAKILDKIGFIEGGLLLNNKKEPLGNKQVRQAMQYAIDCDGLIKAALDGAGVRSGYLATWFSEWGAKQTADLPKRDVTKAKALLAQAGFPNGFKTTIMQNTGRMDVYGNAVEPVAAMLKDVGIDAAVVQADGTAFLSKWRAGDFDMAIGFLLTARPFDPDLSLRQEWVTKGGYNFYGYSNPKVDELLAAQQAAFPDKAKRIPMIKEVLAILEDDVPGVPLYIATNYYIKEPWVKGLDQVADVHAYYGVHHLAGAWIDKR
jgi:peptide/nickel transport system substrate-binding protein